MHNPRTIIPLVVGLILVSCEVKQNQTIDVDLRSVTVLSATISLPTLNLDDSTNSAHLTRLSDGRIQIRDTLTSIVYSVDGRDNLDGVVYSITQPSGTTLVSASPMTHAGTSNLEFLTYLAPITITIADTAVGPYLVEVVALLRSGQRSNAVRRTLLLTKNNQPPALGNPTIRTFSIAGSDSVRVTVAISVSDPDGIADIARVSLHPHNVSDSVVRQLHDDGNLDLGDVLPGDGIYSSIFPIVPAGSLDDVSFDFVAVDRHNLASPVLTRSLRNSPPVISIVSVPDTIRRPTSGTMNIIFRVAVTDSNGLADIDSVYFINLNSQSQTRFPMFDDGDLTIHGDAVAGDGIYSEIVTISSSNTPGTPTFRFAVVDRRGALTVIDKNIVIL
jgi:hypothetical protein